MNYRTERRRTNGLGVARDGVHHWWIQRLTAIALVPLSALFVIPFARTLGQGYEAMLETYRHPFHAIVAIMFIGTGLYHLRLGLQTIIEDYVRAGLPRTAALIVNTLGCWTVGLTGVFAVVKIALGQ